MSQSKSSKNSHAQQSPTSTSHAVSLPKIKQNALQQLAWHDIQNKLAQAEKLMVDYFKEQRWWAINNAEVILDNQTGLLWQGNPAEQKYKYDEQTIAKNRIGTILGLQDWQLPTATQLENIVNAQPIFPLRIGQNYEIKGWWAWLTADKKIAKLNHKNVSYGSFPIPISSELLEDWDLESEHELEDLVASEDEEYILEELGIHDLHFARILPVNSHFLKISYIERIHALWARGFNFQLHEVPNDSAYKAFLANLEEYKLLSAMTQKQPSRQDPATQKKPLDIIQTWKNLDYFSTRLPVIDAPSFTDPNKGLWEFYAPKSQSSQFDTVQSEQMIRARNPALDIKKDLVAIDFGTSSSVVAIRQNGKDELLRIGIQEKDLNKPISADQFENPTILEFLDLKAFQKSWQSEAYRPLVNWDHVHCSHEAKADLNSNKDANSKIISSILPRLKQWALRDEQQHQVRITDQQGTEYILKPLTEYKLVRGQAIQLNQDYPELDPIELYAWFLGMNINWRGRGIFLDYYMTFPVAYPIEVKAKIIASFERGLMRSLPESLLADERINQFKVREWASEPAAYAAAALERLNIEPTAQGVAYAVFDFGGGTTDFDYGIYREPTEQEEDLYDHVIEHFGAAGDQYLGGENLLENLAYLVFVYNQDQCRKQKISFTKPIDASKFVGHEQLIDNSQTAITNTALLMAELRPFWETGKLDGSDTSEGEFKINLLDRQAQVVNCSLSIKEDELSAYLKKQIYQGLNNFFIQLKQAFSQQQQDFPTVIHILLAGNASRSQLVKELLFGIGQPEQNSSNNRSTRDVKLNGLVKIQVLKKESKNLNLHADLKSIFGQHVPDFKIHYPLDADLKNHDMITAKTGVALGLLRLCPGERLKVINHAQASNADNSPFQFYVGKQRRGGIFEVIIKRGDAYNQWQQVGAVGEEGVFLLLYSTLAQAISSDGMKRGAQGLFDQRLIFAGHTAGQKVFARIIAPSQIEVCSANSLDDVQQTGGSNIQQIELG